MLEGFEAWNQLYQPPVHSGVNEPLGPDTVFLFESVILSGVAPSGWDWFDSPRELAGYLLYVGLPDLAGWWFTETSTFGGPPTRLPLRETIAWVAESTEACPGDQEFLLALANELDEVLACPEPIEFADVAAVVDRFSARFTNRGGQSMTLTAYPDAVAAGTALWEAQGDGSEEGRAGWLELCARAGTDPAAAERVVEAFSEAHSV
jgi:hypothetical protein